MLRIFVICALIPIIVNAQSAGFDCKNATTTVEKTICMDSHISSFDYLLLWYYKQAVGIQTNPQSIKDSQRKWLTETRNKCQDLVCLKNAYMERLTILKTFILSEAKLNVDYSGIYESSNGELSVQQLTGNKIKFNLFVTGPYDKDKPFSPKSNQIEGEALLVGNIASYNENEECSIIFNFSKYNVSILEYGCWIYAASSAGNYKLKSKHVE